MRKIHFVPVIFFMFHNTIIADLNEMIHVLKTFFVHRHVQTVTVHTCWPFSDLDKRILEELSSVDISVYFGAYAVQQTQVTPWYRSAVLADISCEKLTNNNYFRQISNKRLFNMQNDWILFDRNATTANTTNSNGFAWKTFNKYLADAYVLPDSGVFLFEEIDDNVWKFWNGFRASKTDGLRVFGMGSGSSNYFHIDSFAFNEQRKNFLGITLKATTVILNTEYFYGFDQKISSDLDVFAHMHYEIVYTLSNQLNFKIDLSIVNDYGWSLGNGSFGGLTGLLETEAVDFSGTGVFIRPDRMNVIDYTVGTVELRTTALFRQPSLSSVHNILSLPFTFEVWLVILINIIVFVIILVPLTRANHRLLENDDDGDDDDHDDEDDDYNVPSIPEIITLVHGAVCQQGFYFKSNLEAVKLVIFILFLTFLFVFTSYSACIAALIQSNSNSITSIRDIVESPMTFSVQISPYGKRYLEETNDADLKRLYRRKILPKGNQSFTKTSVGIEKIRTEFHGFLVEVISAYKMIGNVWREEEKCGLSEIELFKIPLLSIALVKKSGHKDIFKQKLIQQMEVGLSKRISYQWIAPKPSCESSGRAKQYVSVSIADVYLTLKIFGCGVCISLAIFTLEVTHHAWTNRRDENESRGEPPNVLIRKNV